MGHFQKQMERAYERAYRKMERKLSRAERRRQRKDAWAEVAAAMKALFALGEAATPSRPHARVPAKLVLLVLGGMLLGSLVLVMLLILTLTGAWQQLGSFMLNLGLWAAIVAGLALAVWAARRSGQTLPGWRSRVSRSLSAFRARVAVPREPRRHPDYYRKRAGAYRQRIQRLIKGRRPGPLTDVLAAVPPRLARWQERVDQLAGRLKTFESDGLIQRDLKEVPQAITRLERQVALEADPQMRQQMEATLTGYRGQQALLADLARVMRRTRLQLDDTLASMGTIYSQIQVIDAMDIDSPQAARIAGEIDEQVQRLNDVLAALPAAYAAGANLAGAAAAVPAGGQPAPAPAGAELRDAPDLAARRAHLEQRTDR